MKEIALELRRCEEEQLPCVVATIIRVEGSSYRRAGARCLIHQDGRIIGILSGGCIEEDVKEHAAELFREGQPKQVYYDFRAGEDDLWGLGVGCNGAITVWLELFDPIRFPIAAEAMLHDYETRLTCTKSYYALTVLDADPHRLYSAKQRWEVLMGGIEGNAEGSTAGKTIGNAAGGTTASLALVWELPAALPGITTGLMEGIETEVLVELIEPVPHLTIIGAGSDVDDVCQMAKLLNWTVHVVYHETSRAVKSNFPHADELLSIPRADFSSLVLQPRQYVVVMTHNLELDREAVKQLLPSDSIAYLGVLGSKDRIRRLIEGIASEAPLHKDSLQKLHSPIGLDIGAQTPKEIAMSIMAEITAHWNGKRGGSLRITPSSSLEVEEV